MVLLRHGPCKGIDGRGCNSALFLTRLRDGLKNEPMPVSWPTVAAFALLAALGAPKEDPSRSIGHPFSGRLQNGVRLESRGPHHRLRWRARANRWVFGTRPLVEGLRWTATDLAATDGAELLVGNLSRQRGGDLPCSRSHNSGRDADLGLYTLDSDGSSVLSHYYRFGPDGRSLEANGRYHFDDARNWALVRSLLENPHFEVATLVLNPALERRVLDYARAAGADADLLSRARRVLELPSYANLHRNHLHLRIRCPRGHDRCVE